MKRSFFILLVSLTCFILGACGSSDNSSSDRNSSSSGELPFGFRAANHMSLDKVYDMEYRLGVDPMAKKPTLLLSIKYLDLLEEEYVTKIAVANNAAVLIYDDNPQLFDDFEKLSVNVLTSGDSPIETSIGYAFDQENIERFSNRRELAMEFLTEWTECLRTQSAENCTSFFIANEEEIPNLIEVFTEMQGIFPPDYSGTLITGLRISSVEEEDVEFYDIDAVFDSPNAQRLFTCAIQRQEGEMKLIELAY